MALSDKESLKSRRPKRRALEAKGKHWSDGQKLEAVQTYLMLGSVRMTAAALKIPEITLKVWRANAWWKDLEAELKLQDELQLSTRLKNIAEKSFAVVEDRLEHGNYVFDQKTGKIRRIPVNLKDAHKVAMDSVIHKDIIAGRNVEKANDGQIENKLADLAAKFAAMAAAKFTEITDEKRTVDIAAEDVVDVGDSGEFNDQDSGQDNYEDSGYDDEAYPEPVDVPGEPENEVVKPHVRDPNQVTKLQLTIQNEAELAARRKEN